MLALAALLPSYALLRSCEGSWIRNADRYKHDESVYSNQVSHEQEDHKPEDWQDWQAWGTEHGDENQANEVLATPHHGWQDWQTWGPRGEPYKPRRDVIHESTSSSRYLSRNTDNKSKNIRISDGEMSHCFETALTIVNEDKRESLVLEILKREPAAPMPSYRYKDESINVQGESEESSLRCEEMRLEPDDNDSDCSFGIENAELEEYDVDPVDIIKTRAEKQRLEETRREFNSAFQAKGLSYDMDPKKLALAIVKIKIDLGFNISVGRTASNRVRAHLNDKAFDAYQIWNLKFSRKVGQLKKQVDTMPMYTTEEERWKAVSERTGDYAGRGYEGRKRQHPSLQAVEKDADRKASKCWLLLVEKFPTHLQRLAATHPENISVADIEKFSRGLRYKEATQIATAGYIKRYMKRMLNKDKTKLMKFSSLRYKYRLEDKVRMRQMKD